MDKFDVACVAFEGEIFILLTVFVLKYLRVSDSTYFLALGNS